MLKILLVDDSRVTRRMLLDVLLSGSFKDSEFLEAVDGEDALKKLEARNFEVDAVICDLYMPNLDGLGFLEALKARKPPRSFPVIILTADARNARGQEAVQHGAAALLAKPFSPQSVTASLESVLGQRGEPR
jgi:chemosensory pili system protein ChpA (sensor histidine kinase/response regulator)